MAEVEQWLLPTHTSQYPKIKYTYFNESYGSVAPITTMGNIQLLYEHAHMLYMCVPDVINDPSYKWRFYRCSLITGEIDYICDITSNGPNIVETSQYPFGIICDDSYIYWLNTTNGSNYTLYRMNIDTHVVEAVHTGNTYIRGNIFFVSDDKICIPLNDKFVFYNTITTNTDIKTSTGLTNNNRYCMCKGNNLIVTAYSSTLYWYDINENTHGTVALSSSNKASICYKDGKFYIAQSRYLSEFNESTKTISSDAKHYISTAPWTSEIVSVDICGGLIYIVLYQGTQTSPSTMYIVDKNDFRIYYRTIFGFNVSQYSKPFQICRTATYGDTFFLLKDRLCSINYNPKTKYNVGMNNNHIGKNCNNTTKNDFEYDNKYVEFNSTYMTIKNGLIQKEISQFDTDIKQISVNKNEYFKINKIIKE